MLLLVAAAHTHQERLTIPFQTQPSSYVYLLSEHFRNRPPVLHPKLIVGSWLTCL